SIGSCRGAQLHDGTCSSAVRPYCLRSKTWESLRPHVHLCNNATSILKPPNNATSIPQFYGMLASTFSGGPHTPALALVIGAAYNYTRGGAVSLAVDDQPAVTITRSRPAPTSCPSAPMCMPWRLTRRPRGSIQRTRRR
ncbi:MAG: hypothetical protein VB125_01315, partial [Burkholderia sp.]